MYLFQGISPGLARARRPFLLRNIVTGAIITAFVVGVWAYSIRAVSQDVFDDVDAEAKALTPEMRKGVETVEERARKVDEKLKAIVAERFVTRIANNSRQSGSDAQRGILPLLSQKYPTWYGWYDPQKSLVWGAPPIDNMGRIGDKTK